MKTHVRLNLYEREIVASLVQDHNFKPDTARNLVVQYIEIIRKLGGYDSCEEHAERLVKAQQIGYTPEAWLERITEVEREELRDKTIPPQDAATEYAYM